MDITLTRGIFETELGGKIAQYVMEKHGEQKYGEMPYTYHLFGVYQMTIMLFGVECEDTQMGAFTHDVIEDTDETIDGLAEMTNQNTAMQVDNVSKRAKGVETENEYYARVCSGFVSWKIKCADVMFNMSQSKHSDQSRYTHYQRLMKKLIDFGKTVGYDVERLCQMYSFIVGV